MIGPAVDHPVNQEILNDNLAPRWDKLANATTVSPIIQMHEFFTVLGIYFPSVCGVFAGVNMSGFGSEFFICLKISDFTARSDKTKLQNTSILQTFIR